MAQHREHRYECSEGHQWVTAGAPNVCPHCCTSAFHRVEGPVEPPKRGRGSSRSMLRETR